MTQNLDKFKFRAWIPEINKMEYDIQDVYDGSNGMLYKGDFFGDYYNFQHVLENEDIIIMQSTALKDKNGKLIYEGDLAKVYDETIEAERLLSVVWDNEKCGFDIHQYESNDPIFCYMEEFMGSYEVDHELQSLEIIGNIYENPELLENFRKEDDNK